MYNLSLTSERVLAIETQQPWATKISHGFLIHRIGRPFVKARGKVHVFHSFTNSKKQGCLYVLLSFSIEGILPLFSKIRNNMSKIQYSLTSEQCVLLSIFICLVIMYSAPLVEL